MHGREFPVTCCYETKDVVDMAGRYWKNKVHVVVFETELKERLKERDQSSQSLHNDKTISVISAFQSIIGIALHAEKEKRVDGRKKIDILRL